MKSHSELRTEKTQTAACEVESHENSFSETRDKWKEREIPTNAWRLKAQNVDSYTSDSRPVEM
jgi:hypothetical protein